MSTSGNAILDGNGHRVIFRGLARETLTWYPYLEGSHLTAPDIQAINDSGANIVRVPLGEQYWNPGECEYVSTYANVVDKVVASITSRGMVALLDLHTNTRIPCMDSQPQKMADVGSLTFWRDVASRYAGNPLVAFQLYNEPHDISWSIWRNGGLVLDSDLILWNAVGMQQMYDAVRSTGATNLVLVSGNDWGSDPVPSSYLLDGTNIVYAAQYYTCSDQPPPFCTVPNPTDPAPAPGQRLDKWGTFTTKHPVTVTEFGWPSPNDGRYNANVIAWAEAHGVGWIAYQWNAPERDSSFSGAVSSLIQALAPQRGTWELLKSYEPDYQPSAAGVPVFNGFAKNATSP